MGIISRVKNTVNSVILSQVFKVLFEQVPVLKKLNGYKTKIGAGLICLYYVWKSAYPVVLQYFPDTAPQLISFDLLMGQYVQFVADALVVLGVQHNIYKASEAKDHEQRLYS